MGEDGLERLTPPTEMGESGARQRVMVIEPVWKRICWDLVAEEDDRCGPSRRSGKENRGK